MTSQFLLLKKRRFLPLFITQFLGALNDNLFKTVLSVLVAYEIWHIAGWRPEMLVSLAAGLFIVPFILFSPLGGDLADKFDKRVIIRHLKLAEIVLVLAAIVGLAMESVQILMLILFLLGLQSALFSPSKFSILPQHLKHEELIGGNALVNTGTYLAILLGTILGGLWAVSEIGLTYTAAALLIASFAGYTASRFVPEALAPVPDLKLNFNMPLEAFRIIKYAWGRGDGVFLAILGNAWFFFTGSMFLAQLPNYTKHILGVDNIVLTIFLTTFSVGIALGGLLNNSLLKSEVKATFVPAAALAIGLFTLDLYFASQVFIALPNFELIDYQSFLSGFSGLRIMFDLLAISVAGGLYVVPLKTIIQDRTPQDHCARVLAGSALMDAVFVLAAALIAMSMFAFGAKVVDLFILMAALAPLIAVMVSRIKPKKEEEEMGRPLLVFAMKEESQDVFDDYNVLHTGIGKVNASHGLMQYLRDNKPSVVINMGTAGSRKFPGGTIVNPTSFIQRDMDVTELGFERFQTPFSDDPVIIEYGRVLEDLPQAVCGSGDNFDVSEESGQFGLVDMEAYALALICQREGIDFLCLKYISDGADGDSEEDWNAALHRTAEKLREVLEKIDL